MPTVCNRLALMMVAGYHLPHWRANVVVQNYMRSFAIIYTFFTAKGRELPFAVYTRQPNSTKNIMTSFPQKGARKEYYPTALENRGIGRHAKRDLWLTNVTF